MQHPIKSSHLRWLRNEIPHWQDEGIINADQAERLNNRYQPTNTAWTSWFVGLLAVVLVGGGVILILGHNWHQLSKLTRAIIAITPLIILQVLCLFLYRRQRIASLLGESLALALGIAQGTGIALISQTYHQLGLPYEFFLLWLVMALPSALLLGSYSLFMLSMMVFLSMITSLPYYVDTLWQAIPWQASVIIVVSLIASAYFLIRSHRNSQYTPKHTLKYILAHWAFALVLGAVWLKTIPDPSLLTIVVSAGCYFVFGLLLKDSHKYNPWRILGFTALLIILFIQLFTLTTYLGTSRLFTSDMPLIVDMIITVLPLAIAIVLSTQKRLTTFGNHWHQVVLLVLPMVFLLLIMVGDNRLLHYLISHTYTLILGVAFIRDGTRQLRPMLSNFGVLIICTQVAILFFDDYWSMIVRGASFIACGALLFIVNRHLLKRKAS